MNREFTVAHALEVYSSLERGTITASEAARLANVFERLHGEFSSGAILECSLCRLRRQHGEGGVQNGTNRFVVDNPVVPGRRISLCDYHLAQHLLWAKKTSE